MLSLFIINIIQIPRFISFGVLSNDEAYPTIQIQISCIRTAGYTLNFFILVQSFKNSYLKSILMIISLLSFIIAIYFSGINKEKAKTT